MLEPSSCGTVAEGMAVRNRRYEKKRRHSGDSICAVECGLRAQADGAEKKRGMWHPSCRWQNHAPQRGLKG